jgi:hypothetical protein
MYLVNKHENNSDVTSPSPGEQGQSVGVLEEAVTESPVHGHRRRDGQSEHIESCKYIHILELRWFVHCVHDFPVVVTQARIH